MIRFSARLVVKLEEHTWDGSPSDGLQLAEMRCAVRAQFHTRLVAAYSWVCVPGTTTSRVWTADRGYDDNLIRFAVAINARLKMLLKYCVPHDLQSRSTPFLNPDPLGLPRRKR